MLFSCATALFFCNSYINIALPDVSSSTSQGCVWSICQISRGPNRKKNHFPNDRFLSKNLLQNDVFGSSERLPPLSAVPPTNKKTHPPISKPHPAKKSISPILFAPYYTILYYLNHIILINYVNYIVSNHIFILYQLYYITLYNIILHYILYYIIFYYIIINNEIMLYYCN